MTVPRRVVDAGRQDHRSGRLALNPRPLDSQTLLRADQTLSALSRPFGGTTLTIHRRPAKYGPVAALVAARSSVGVHCLRVVYEGAAGPIKPRVAAPAHVQVGCPGFPR